MPESIDTGDKAVILFDGSCGLCNRSVKFVLRHERKQTLYFSPLQSAFGKSLLEKYNLTGRADSVVLIKNNRAYLKSGAALRITTYLKGRWLLLWAFLIVPPFIRNWVYDYIAANRITWFGTADYCEMITPELRKRFLE